MTERLFDFNFVDRRLERSVITDFIGGKSESNILWINGPTGVGKSFLVENTILLDKSCHNIFISPQAQMQIDNTLEIIIEKIEKSTGIKFINFFRDNYTSIADITKKVVKSILSYHHIDLDWFFDIAFDSSKVFVNKRNENQNSSKIIEQYIKHILSENNDLMIILDNFTYCDNKSQSILIDILKTYMNSNNIKFIIVTTNEELEKQKFLKSTLLEKLSTVDIFLSGFNDEQCFKQIIEKKFIMTPELNELVTYIYKLCKGIPESLKELLRNLVLSNSIEQEYTQDKAIINIENLKNYLLNCSNDELPKIDFRYINDFESFFLQIITYIKYPVSIKILRRIFTYLYEKLFYETSKFNNNLFTAILNKYIGIDVLDCKKEDNIPVICFKHDLLYLRLNEHFSNYVNKEQVYFYLYQFTNFNREMLLESGLNHDRVQSMIVYYSYQADIDEWISLNYQFGLKKYINFLYYEAINIFQRLVHRISCLADTEKLNIARCYYDTGDYSQCNLILKAINSEQLNNHEKFVYYLEWGKTLFVKLNALDAIKKIDLALAYASNEVEYYNALSMKLTALAESPRGDKKAREIFRTDVQNLVNDKSKIRLISNILRNCWTYCTGEEAIKYLKIALEEAEKEKNIIDTAYTYNNLGLEYIRGWQLNEAKQVYSQSLHLLENTKKHETSYPLNNLAVCEMLNQNYQLALDYLIEANLWNRAPFIQKVIETHMLICNFYLGNMKLSEKYANKLFEFVFNNEIQDYNTIRKILLNLSIYFYNTNNMEKAQKCIEFVYKYIKNSYSEYRGTIFYNKIMKDNKSLESLTYTSEFFKILDFEPWLTTLSHE